MKTDVPICPRSTSREETRLARILFERFGDPDARQRCGRDARCDACRRSDPSFGSPAPRACGCPFYAYARAPAGPGPWFIAFVSA